MENRSRRILRAALLAALALSLLVSVDLMLNYQASLLLEDGSFGCTSVLHRLFGIFGDANWSRRRFYEAHAASAWVTAGLAAVNLALAARDVLRRK